MLTEANLRERSPMRGALIFSLCGWISAAILLLPAHRANALASSSSETEGLEEVVVTAEKRAERLQDVPVPVSVLSAQVLLANDVVDLRDYYSKVPGVNMTIGNGDQPIVSIRGITTGGTSNPTAGFTIDDVPYGSSTFVGGGLTAIDLDPSDLARIEILRGPQGTLYGASSMGGLIKYVTTDPVLGEFSGRVASGIDSIYNGNGLGYNLRGNINLPLGDSLAMLVSAFGRHEPGYVNDPVHNLQGINTVESNGERIALLWTPGQNTSLKINAIHQYRKSDGDGEVDLSSAQHLDYSFHIPQLEGSTREITFVDATLNARLGSADLTSITSYTHTNINLRNVDTGTFGPSLPPTEASAYSGLRVNDKYTEEIRASLPLTTHISWLIGAFYTHEDSKYHDIFSTADAETGSLLNGAGDELFLTFPTTYKEVSVFSTATLKFTDQFDVQIGGRETDIRQSVANYLTIFGAVQANIPPADSKANAFTYLFTPRFRFTEDLMGYARIASGYRAGGPNYTRGPGVPDQYSPDKTRNYELGMKGDILDKLVSFDASIYRIDWKDIQLNIYNPKISQISFIGNAGLARSQGVELSAEVRPVSGLTLSAWGAYGDATLQSIPASASSLGATATPGARLPFSSRLTGNVAADYSWALPDALIGSVGTSLTYVGNRPSDFSTDPRTILPSYAQVDAHAGIKSKDGWDVNAFVTNLTDKRGIASVSPDGPAVGIVIRPRTVGINIARDF